MNSEFNLERFKKGEIKVAIKDIESLIDFTYYIMKNYEEYSCFIFAFYEDIVRILKRNTDMIIFKSNPYSTFNISKNVKLNKDKIVWETDSEEDKKFNLNDFKNRKLFVVTSLFKDDFTNFKNYLMRQKLEIYRYHINPIDIRRDKLISYINYYIIHVYAEEVIDCFFITDEDLEFLKKSGSKYIFWEDIERSETHE